MMGRKQVERIQPAGHDAWGPEGQMIKFERHSKGVAPSMGIFSTASREIVHTRTRILNESRMCRQSESGDEYEGWGFPAAEGRAGICLDSWSTRAGALALGELKATNNTIEDKGIGCSGYRLPFVESG